MSASQVPAPAACRFRLADGTAVLVRPIEFADAERLVRFHEDLSQETVYLRYFSAHPHLSANEVNHFTSVDGAARMALVALVDDELAGVGRYDRDSELPAQAEVAFVVADRWQGRGIGTLLLDQLAAYARSQGIRRFAADTLAFNARMQAVFRHSGFRERTKLEDGVVHVQLDLYAG